MVIFRTFAVIDWWWCRPHKAGKVEAESTFGKMQPDIIMWSGWAELNNTATGDKDFIFICKWADTPTSPQKPAVMSDWVWKQPVAYRVCALPGDLQGNMIFLPSLSVFSILPLFFSNLKFMCIYMIRSCLIKAYMICGQASPDRRTKLTENPFFKLILLCWYCVENSYLNGNVYRSHSVIYFWF